MLKFASDNDLNAILKFCDKNLLGTRIACYCLAYGFERDFLKIWFDDSKGKVDTVIAKFYDSITLVTCAEDVEEISDFIRMIGFSSLETYLSTSQKLSLNADDIKKSYVFSGSFSAGDAENLGEEFYKDLYNLVSENIPGSFSSDNDSYFAFLSDFTFRKRRNLARCKGIITEGKLVSSVITSAETPTSAIISAVVCDKNIRGKGLGKRTVSSMVHELIDENKSVFVVALNETAQGFYEHLGFAYYDSIVIVNDI